MRRALLCVLLSLGGLLSGGATADAARPNIVWIVVDDMSPYFGCYGEKLIATPNVDRMAREGTRFARAFTTAPVCSPSRSALVTGMYQTSIGAHHHRSGRGELKIELPAGVTPAPVLFQRAGYYTCIGGPLARGNDLGKTDYNFEWPRTMYDGNDWAGRAAGQPFFMQVQLHGGKQRERGTWPETVREELGEPTDPARVTLPPYYPRDAVLLEDWAWYLDAVRYTDREVGEVLARLEREGLLASTVVFFVTDHGISHARGKQFLYDEGIHVPLVVMGPGLERGAVRDDLVELIDLAATSLALAGIEIPPSMQGRDLLAANYQPRTAVFSARDRCDETVDRIRAARTERFKYIRNDLPERPHLQPSHYKDHKQIVKRLRELHAAGQLDELTERNLFAPKRAPEELYDLETDPFELNNLAADAEHAKMLAEMRKRLSKWEQETRAQGAESPEMYDSDMAVYLQAMRGERRQVFEANMELMRRWAREGK